MPFQESLFFLDANERVCGQCAVLGCSNLKDTEWFSQQDPYVHLEYGSTKHRTRTDTGFAATFEPPLRLLCSTLIQFTEYPLPCWLRRHSFSGLSCACRGTTTV